MKTIFNILAIFFLTIASLNAQEKVDLFGISFIHNPGVGLMDPANDNLESIDLKVTELDAFIKYPIKLGNDKTVLVNALKWHFVKAPFDDLPNERSFEANLHSIQYDFMVIHKLSQKWQLLASLRPTLASNFKDGIGSDDFFFQGMLGFKYIRNEYMNYGAGMSYTNGFGEPNLVPVLLFNYSKNKIRTEVKAPVSLSFTYSAKKTIYGFQAKLDGGQYHLASQDGDGTIITNNETVKFSRYNLGPTLGWKINDSSRFEVSAGISLKRTLKVISNDGLESDYDLKNGLFFKSSFIFGK
ncbi:DUF6268 family outer membrane beta-barrel protein [Aestuariivivens sediminicola]|uniref:DUF6268 family outer membrane beta-barrel protein n=1 Tax=Aestuariivivens sediminicola TaxID=2913560 RepID=UPI001F5AF07C|nr:DUF6268 family outer membrane beta-barrel protein [Aestuariivivens sediminicola]